MPYDPLQVSTVLLVRMRCHSGVESAQLDSGKRALPSLIKVYVEGQGLEDCGWGLGLKDSGLGFGVSEPLSMISHVRTPVIRIYFP